MATNNITETTKHYAGVKESDLSEFKSLLNEQLGNPEFKKEWDAIQSEADAIRREIKRDRQTT